VRADQFSIEMKHPMPQQIRIAGPVNDRAARETAGPRLPIGKRGKCKGWLGSQT
jgi:hypothetical protein